MLKRTELEAIRMKAGRSRTSRIEGAADILTTEGSERDNQPVREAGLSALTCESGSSATRTERFCVDDREGSQFVEESRGGSVYRGTT